MESEWAGQQQQRLIELIDIDMEPAPVDLVFWTDNLTSSFLQSWNSEGGGGSNPPKYMYCIIVIEQTAIFMNATWANLVFILVSEQILKFWVISVSD